MQKENKNSLKVQYSEEFAKVQQKLNEAGIRVTNVNYELELSFPEGTDMEIGDSLENVLRKHASDKSIELTCEAHDAEENIWYTMAHSGLIDIPRSVNLSIKPVLSIKNNMVYFGVGEDEGVEDFSIVCSAGSKTYNLTGGSDAEEETIKKVMSELGYTFR